MKRKEFRREPRTWKKSRRVYGNTRLFCVPTEVTIIIIISIIISGEALNGFVLVVTAEGTIFFCSHTIQDYLGFHQTDVMHQSVFELIHTEDQQEFRRNLHWALNPPAGPGPPTDPTTDGESSSSPFLVSYNPDQLPPENSSFLERGFICRFRCLLDNSSGFLDNQWKWVQANARLVYKNGKPDYIIATQRPLVDEEGGEHLTKRSMHLPFTFATGEALLYQTGHPLHGFPDSFQGKAKGSKSKKGKLDKSSADDLDPKSLLGALMSQDESVYVCQPNTEPQMSHQSSLISEQQSETGGFSSLFGADSWHIVSNGETGRCNSKTSSFDPLLSTLDSLSLDGDETCSNSELFSALENLGLNAEDLELLLLDERMIQVELDTNHIPTLSDLLTNNEILSYIHDSLESGTDGEEQGNRGGFGLSGHPPNADSVPGVSQPACLTTVVPPALPNSSRQPIVQLSQKMQQHVRASELVKSQPGQIQSQPRAADTSVSPGIPNSHLTVTAENLHHPSSHAHHHPHTVLKASQLNSEHKHLHSLLELSQQWQLHQDQHSVHHQLENSQRASSPGFQNQLELATSRSYVLHPNGHAAIPPHTEVNHTGYSISNVPYAGGTLLNGVTMPDVCHYQRPYQLQGHQKHQQILQQTQIPPSCLPPCPSQSSALDLEQLLGLSSPQHSLPSLEAYSIFSGAEDAAHSKMENGCLLSASNAAYIKTCQMPNGNGVAQDDLPVSCPEGLAALQDPQKSGFFL
ncbi:hypothetical protein F2P81_002333 [Scophthalmus maximus]|uniref:PAS domain-containing protein n=1 Tax=Scophthalmus maximus TaxID=52904 RepID=A0A6A4TRF4_SCOMX|nr:hypothetical protein F2P81_002333 [Scophthalmus maximus]